jgi:hypothetical protein
VFAGGVDPAGFDFIDWSDCWPLNQSVIAAFGISQKNRPIKTFDTPGRLTRRPQTPPSAADLQRSSKSNMFVR